MSHRVNAIQNHSTHLVNVGCKKIPIYLDYASTTPVDPQVVQKMNACLLPEGMFGNANSNHVFGRQAKERIEEARGQIAGLLNSVPRNLIFTSGATEANNLAIKGVTDFYQNRGKHIITAETEHKSVLEICRYLATTGFEVTYLPVNRHGLVELHTLSAAFRKDTVLVSIMHVNSETGIVQDIAAIGALAREKGVFFHVDATQSIGKIALNLQELPVDLLSFSGHKIYGPKGIGALYLGDNPRVRLAPQMHGGDQERKLRPGTLPTHQIVGLGEACRILKERLETEFAIIKKLRDRFWQGIADLPQVYLNLPLDASVPHILSVRFEAMGSQHFLEHLVDELAVSKGSACNTLYIEPSYVLRALGLTETQANASIRFSFGRFTTQAHIEKAIECVRKHYLTTIKGGLA